MLIERFFEKRGLNEDVLEQLNNAEHQPLLDMDKMVKALKLVHDQQTPIVVLPDFDMDGITSGVLLTIGLDELGFNVDIYGDHDYRRGHGVFCEDIDRIHARYPHNLTIITTDTGIDAHETINYAHSLGIKMLVTDHHKEIITDPFQLHYPYRADVVIDPARIDETYPNIGICGAHVAYQVVLAYTQTYAPKRLELMKYLALFAGLGTVSDVMPLLYENRQVVKESLAIARLLYQDIDPESSRLPDPRESTGMTNIDWYAPKPLFRQAFIGFSNTLSILQRHKMVQSSEEISVGLYGFYIAPMFNAIRRVESPLSEGFAVFFAKDNTELIERLIENNNARKERVETLFDEMQNAEQPFAPLLWFTDAPAGIKGLLAAKISSQTRLPALVVSQPQGVHDHKLYGSGRSPGWFAFNSAVNEQRGAQARGHEHAFGVNIEIKHLDTVTANLHDLIVATQNKLILSGQTSMTNEDFVLYSEGLPEELNQKLIEQNAIKIDPEEIEEFGIILSNLEPFGKDFEPPLAKIYVNPSLCHFNPLGKSGKAIKIVTPEGLGISVIGHTHELMEMSHITAVKTQDRINNTIDYRVKSETHSHEALEILAKIERNKTRGGIFTNIKAEEIDPWSHE